MSGLRGVGGGCGVGGVGGGSGGARMPLLLARGRAVRPQRGSFVGAEVERRQPKPRRALRGVSLHPAHFFSASPKGVKTSGGRRARGRRPLHAPVPPPAPRDHPAAGMLDPRRPPAGWHAGRVPVGARGGRAQVSRVGGSRAGAGVRWGPLASHMAAAGRL